MQGSGSAVVVHHEKRFVGGGEIMLFYANSKLAYKEAYSQTNNRLEGNLFNAAS